MADAFSYLPFFYAVIAFAAVAVLIAPMRVVAKKAGLVDRPGGRKAHEGDIPLIGGAVVFPVFIAVSVFAGFGIQEYWPLYTALLVLLVTGVIDDRVHLHSWTKFIIQFVAAILVVFPGGAVLHDLGDLFGLGVFELGWMALPFSIISVVLLINAVNLIDGLDGLAGGAGVVMLGWFLAACFFAGDIERGLPVMILMAALAGFLVYNMRSPLRKKASVFFGDAGSLCLGLMLGWYAITLSQESAGGAATKIIEPMAVAWILALPIWDECAQFNRRVREGRHPFSPDRGHFHYHFIEAGFSPGRSVALVLAVVFLTGAAGVLGAQFGVPLYVLTSVWICAILMHIYFSKDLDRYPRWIKKMWCV